MDFLFGRGGDQSISNTEKELKTYQILEVGLEMLEVLEPRLLLSALPIDVNSQQPEGSLLTQTYISNPPVANGVGGRVMDGLQVFYGFSEGSGGVVEDMSGVGSPLDLTIGDVGNVAWGDGVLTVNAETLITSGGPATKINQAVQASGEITIEAWISTAALGQNGPARIVTLSSGPYERNFTLGQGVYGTSGDRIDVRFRTTSTGVNGSSPSLSSPVGSLTTGMTHVVYTRASDGTATLYMDNQVVASGVIGGDTSNWDLDFEFGLANEIGGGRPWYGTYDLVAIYDQALDAGEVAQNFAAGSDAELNLDPTAEDDFEEIDEDTVLVVGAPGVLDNDSDLDSVGLTVSAFDALSAAGAVVVVNADGSYSYDPTDAASLQSLALNESVIDTFTYTVDDGEGGGDTATVYVTVNGVNDQPIAQDDSFVTFNNETVSGDMLADNGSGADSDVDTSDVLGVLAVDGSASHVDEAYILPSFATVTVMSDGTFDYDPTTSPTLSSLASGESVVDSFTYLVGDGSGGESPATVRIEVFGPNTAPVADDDDYNVNEDEVLTVAAPGVLDGDVDGEDDEMAAILVSDVSNGELVLNEDGSFTYTPDEHFWGEDSFTYKVSDGVNESNVATVMITVNSVNDDPMIDAGADFDVKDGTAANLTATFSDVDIATGDTHVAEIDWGDGTVEAGVVDAGAGTITGSHTYAGVGQYTVTVTVTDQAGTGVSASDDVVVKVNEYARVIDGLQAFYDFDAGNGNTVYDTSGVGSALNLTIGNLNDVTWGDGVLTIDSAAMIQSAGAASKIIEAVKLSGELTVEAWLISSDLTQNGPARIVTISEDSGNRNFTLGQGVYSSSGDRFEARLRTTTTGLNGSNPAVDTPVGSLGSELTHVVYTFKDSTASIYIDNQLVSSEVIGGNVSNWNDGYILGFGNEATGDRPWLGTLDMVAFYDQALTAEQVEQNYDAGADTQPGELEVWVDGILLADGETIPIDFGEILQAAGNADIEFTINNVGDSALSIGEVLLANNTGFEVAVQPSSVVDAGGSTTFTIRMLDDAPGDKSADVSFGNGDDDENPFDFKVEGSVADAGLIVTDEFNGTSLDTNVWNLIDNLGDGILSFDGSHLTIEIPASIPHDMWVSGEQDAVRIMQNAADGDLQLEVKFDALVSGEYTMNGLLIEQDSENFIRFDFYSSTTGANVFAAVFDGNEPQVPFEVDTGIDANLPMILRVSRTGDHWVQEYSNDGINWDLAGEFDHAMTVNNVGVYVGSAGENPPAHVAMIDYFRNTFVPVIDETPPVLSNLVTTEGSTTISVTADTDEPATVLIEYGLDTGYGLGSIETTLGVNHSALIEGLSDNTTYYLRITATDDSDNSATPVETTVTTLEIDVTGPVVSNVQTQAGSAAIFVTADTDELATWTVRYGLTNSYELGTISGTTFATSHEIVIESLNAQTPYFVEVVMTDASSNPSAPVELEVGTTEVLITDEFAGDTLNKALWEFIDPQNDSSVIVNGTQLEITVPAGSSHDIWDTGNDSARIMQAANDGDFQLEVKYDSLVTGNVAMNGILVEQDDGNFLRFEFFSDNIGANVFVASFAASVPTVEYGPAGIASNVPMLMRVTRTGDDWLQEFKIDNGPWTVAGSFTYVMNVAKVGVYAANAGDLPGYTAVIDYFRDTSEPVEDVDPPVVSDVNTLALEESIQVTATSNEPATLTIEYGLDTNYAMGSVVSAEGVAFDETIGGLTGGTTYFLRITATDASDNTSDPILLEVQTATPDTTAPVVSNLVSRVGPGAIQLTADTDELATWVIRYGLDAGYGLGTVTNGTPSLSHEAMIEGLSASTTYYIEIVATDVLGNATDPIELVIETSEVMVSDEFNDTQVNDALWDFIDPVGDSNHAANGSQLTITVNGGTPHDIWDTGNNAPRLMQAANDVDMQIEVKFDSLVNGNLAMNGIFVEESDGNFLRFEFFSDSSSVNVFVASFAGGNPTVEYGPTGIAADVPMVMRVTRTGDQWLQEFSVNGGPWFEAGSFTYALNVTSVGVYAANAGDNPPAYTTTIDYFRNNEQIIPDAAEIEVLLQGTEVIDDSTTPLNFGALALGSNRDLIFTINNVGEQVLTVGQIDLLNNDGFEVIQQPVGNVPGGGSTTFVLRMLGDTIGAKSADVSFVNGDSDENPFDFSVSGTVNEVSRVTAGLQALYEFSAGSGGMVYDISGVGTALDLSIADLGAVSWGNGVLTLNSSTLISSAGAASKIIDAVKSSGEMTMEAWFSTANLNQNGPARIISISDDPSNRNFTLGQGVYASSGDRVEGRMRTTTTGNNGSNPAISSPAGSLDMSLTHVVYTYADNGDVTIYMDNVVVATGNIGGDVSNWDENYQLGLGNELTGDRPWLGTFDLVAFYDRALTAGEVTQNFEAGTDAPPPPENQLPVVDAGEDRTVDTGIVVNLVANFTDANTTDTHTATIDWGDGTITTGNVSQAFGTVGGSHVYTVDGLYTVTVTVTDQRGGVGSDSFEMTVNPGVGNQGPIVDVWYGDTQNFGHLGNPQQWVDILGNVSDVDGIASLTYTLNGGASQTLMWGHDKRRLVGDGDFVVELDHEALIDGENTVVITAVDGAGYVTTQTVNVMYEAGNVWPLPYTIDWSNVGNINDVAMVVDGNWQYSSQGVRTVQVGYDRLINIGDLSWTDYEITVPITVHSVSYYPSPSYDYGYEPGIGVILRWDGHNDAPPHVPGDQPRSGYIPLGAVAWYRYYNNPRFEMMNHETEPVVYSNGLAIVPETTYMYKARVETVTSGYEYTLTVWEQGQPEESGMTMHMFEPLSAPSAGSVLLVAHKVDATFGDVTITSTETEVQTPTISPAGGAYLDEVEITLDTSTVGAVIYYTLDGSEPTQSSYLYEGPFTIYADATVKAKAFNGGLTPSGTAEASYTVYTGEFPRVTNDLQVLYEFDAGDGTTVYDTSGVGTALNLNIADESAVTWGSGVLTVDSSTLISTTGGATKITVSLVASNEITIEAWIATADLEQNGPARIVTLSGDPSTRNFTLGQGVAGSTGDRVEVRLRTTTTGDNGNNPTVSSPVGSLDTEMTHIMYTRDDSGLAMIYIDNVVVASGFISGDFSNWDASYDFALANELTGDRPWLGTFDLVAVYSRALTSNEVTQNYLAGSS